MLKFPAKLLLLLLNVPKCTQMHLHQHTVNWGQDLHVLKTLFSIKGHEGMPGSISNNF